MSDNILIPTDLTKLPTALIKAKVANAFNAGDENKLHRTLLDAAWALLQREAAKRRIGSKTWLQIGDTADVIEDFAVEAVMEGVLPKLRADGYKSAWHLINSLMKSLDLRVNELQRHAYDQHMNVSFVTEEEDEDGNVTEDENPLIHEESKLSLRDGPDAIGMPDEDRIEAEKYAAEDENDAKKANTKLLKGRARHGRHEANWMVYQGIIERLRAGKMDRLPQYTTESHVVLVSMLYMGHSLEEAAPAAGMTYGSVRNLVSKWQRQAQEIEDTPTVPTEREYRREHACHMLKLRSTATAQIERYCGDIVYRNPENRLDRVWQRDARAMLALDDWRHYRRLKQGEITVDDYTEQWSKPPKYRENEYTKARNLVRSISPVAKGEIVAGLRVKDVPLAHGRTYVELRETDKSVPMRKVSKSAALSGWPAPYISATGRASNLHRPFAKLDPKNNFGVSRSGPKPDGVLEPKPMVKPMPTPAGRRYTATNALGVYPEPEPKPAAPLAMAA